MEPVLDIQHVSRFFAVRGGLLAGTSSKITAVHDVSLFLMPGETLGLVGESGSGKSTLARMAVRLLPVSEGQILLEGKSLQQWPAAALASRMQMVFQDPFSSLNPRMSIGASITEPLLMAQRNQGLTASMTNLRPQAEAMLERVGLDPQYYSRYPHEFSGGQRQRIAVARALIAGASTLVCDEPVSALDASVQAQILNLLKDIQAERNLSYLFISHDLGVVGFMSDRVAVMYLGKIVELADREAMFTHPAHPYTQALLMAAPVRDPSHRIERPLLTGELPSPLSPPSGCAFHPRCPYAREDCSQHIPPWEEVRPGQWARCLYPLPV